MLFAARIGDAACEAAGRGHFVRFTLEHPEDLGATPRGVPASIWQLDEVRRLLDRGARRRAGEARPTRPILNPLLFARKSDPPFFAYQSGRLGLSALLSLYTTTDYYEFVGGSEMFRVVGSTFFAYGN